MRVLRLQMGHFGICHARLDPSPLLASLERLIGGLVLLLRFLSGLVIEVPEELFVELVIPNQ